MWHKGRHMKQRAGGDMKDIYTTTSQGVQQTVSLNYVPRSKK